MYSLKKSGISNNCFDDVTPHSSSIHVTIALIYHARREDFVISKSSNSVNCILPEKSRIKIKFLVKLKQSVLKTFKILTDVYGDETLAGEHVFEWHKRFLGGRDSVEDDEHAESTRADWKYTRIYNFQRRLRVLVEKCRIDSSHLLKWGTHFTSGEEVQGLLLKVLPNTSFHNCYQHWQHRMQEYVNAEGNYFEGDIVPEN
ncbi:hypothetical protein TNCV_1690181 [Trichonephila clavipes]|nr:hypothetical protein TNCV_1690181 [Trichonephila clavipes]